MQQEQVDLFMAANANKFPVASLPMIREALLQCPDYRWSVVSSLKFKDPVVAFVLSIFLGEFGVDRFYLGNIGVGVGKLLTGGACGVWWLIDLFLIMEAARRANYRMLANVL